MKTVFVDSYQKVNVGFELSKINRLIETFTENLIRKEALNALSRDPNKDWITEFNRFSQRFYVLLHKAHSGNNRAATKLLNLCYPKQRFMFYCGDVFVLVHSDGEMPLGTKIKRAFVRTSTENVRYFYGVNPIANNVYEGMLSLMPKAPFKVDMVEYGVCK
ncbi:MAG: hypothetical protein EKK57_07800 [Proteobacteria bacterium]|nr:MAG: hypothetical protein EKK57_07800 [Pseudomonadota bacterium]